MFCQYIFVLQVVYLSLTKLATINTVKWKSFINDKEDVNFVVENHRNLSHLASN